MSLLHDKKQHNFESFGDLDTLLTFMAGCAIRERKARIKEQKGTLCEKDNVHEEATIRDFCKVVALIEADSDEDVEAKLRQLKDWVETIR